MSSWEQRHIQEALQNLRQKLHSTFPFRHSSEFHDEDNIKRDGEVENHKLWYALLRKLESRSDLRLQAKDDLARELRIQLEKVVETFLAKNNDHKTAWVTFLEKDIEHILEKFKWTCEVKLLVQHPETDMESAQRIVQEATSVACGYFDEHYSHENADLYGQLKATLMQKLDLVGKEVLANHSRRLEDNAVKEARNAIVEVKSIVSSMLRQLKLEVSDLGREVSKLSLKEKTQNLENFLKDKGFKLLNGPYPRVYLHLVEDVENAMKILGNQGEEGNMGLEDSIAWVERLDEQLNDRFKSVEQSNENEGSGEAIVAVGKRKHQQHGVKGEGNQVSASKHARLNKTQTTTVVDDYRDSTSPSVPHASDTNENLMVDPEIPIEDSSLSGKDADSVLREKLKEKLELPETEHLEMQQSHLAKRVPAENVEPSFSQDGVDISMSVTAGPYFQQLIKDENEEDAFESEMKRNSEVVSAPSSVRSSARLALKEVGKDSVAKGSITRNLGQNVAVPVDAPLQARDEKKRTKEKLTHGSSAVVAEMLSASPSIPPNLRRTRKASQITDEGFNSMCDRAGAENFSMENESETVTPAKSSEPDQFQNQPNIIANEFPIESNGVLTAEAVIHEIGGKQLKAPKTGEFHEKDKAVQDTGPGVKQSPQICRELLAGADVENSVRILDSEGGKEILSLEESSMACTERLDEQLNDRVKSVEQSNENDESEEIMAAGGKRNHQQHGNNEEGDQGVSASKQARLNKTQTPVADGDIYFLNSTLVCSVPSALSDTSKNLMTDTDIQIKDISLSGKEADCIQNVPLVSGTSENAMTAMEIKIVDSSLSGKEADSILNVPDEEGDFPLLRAIREGKKIAFIQEMLDDGANVNIKDVSGINAAHEVIYSLIDGKRNIEGAIAILNLLVTRGFCLINDVSWWRGTPIAFAMHYEGLCEDLLSWFIENGADVNAVQNYDKNSVLLVAVREGQRPEIIKKILDFGGNPMHVNERKENALHVAARSGHHSALEIFVDLLDVNAKKGNGETPLHLLFGMEGREYQNCLEILLKKGADFSASAGIFSIPIVRWIGAASSFGNIRSNPFPALINLKDMLPITEEVASLSLTAIVVGVRIQRGNIFFVDARNKFARQFTRFLIEEKKAKLLLTDEGKSTMKKRTKQKWTKQKHTNPRYKWNTQRWNKLLKGMLTSKFFEKLKQSVSGIESTDQHVLVKGRHVGVLEFHAGSNIVGVRIETVLNCLLACEYYNGFNRICREMLRGFLQDHIFL